NPLRHGVRGLWEKFYFTLGDLGYPVFATKYAKVGVYICYDRHFPEGARILGLNGAEIVFNPSATAAGLSEYLWEREQPAHGVANGYYVGAINRVGEEKPWSIGQFYGKSYFCNPRGKIIAQASRDKDEVLVANLDLDVILEVRKVWQFFRDRRPETYGILTTQSGKAGSGDREPRLRAHSCAAVKRCLSSPACRGEHIQTAFPARTDGPCTGIVPECRCHLK